MDTPHYTELIKAINSRQTNVEVWEAQFVRVDDDLEGYFRYSMKGLPRIIDAEPFFYVNQDCVTPDKSYIDGRKNKRFYYKDYPDIFTLADDLIAYIQGIHNGGYYKPRKRIVSLVKKWSSTVNVQYNVLDSKLHKSKLIKPMEVELQP